MLNGVICNLDVVKGVVEILLNVGVVIMFDVNVEIYCLICFFIDSGKDYVVSMLDLLGKLVGVKIEVKGSYSGWQFDVNLLVMYLVWEIYQCLFNKILNIQIIYVGLECGLFKKFYLDMDMVFIGFIIIGFYFLDEQVYIESVGYYWILLIELLKVIFVK